MEEQILAYLKDLVSIGSISDTSKENQAADYLEKAMQEQSYFVRYPDQMGKFCLENDHLKRTVPYGLVKGTNDRTLILTGHYDVVGIEEYGKYQELAFQVDSLCEAFADDETLDGETVKDLNSDQWIFGRGTADMKGGLALALGLLDLYGKTVMNHPTEKFCNLLFFAVPDEESYSHGMKGAIALLQQLKVQYSLNYDYCIDLEPCNRRNQSHELFLGSVGKCMPAVLVQGAKAHVGECFKGISALGILNQFYLKTELSPQFSDQYEQDVCMPPTWLAMRDMKDEYDVSLPYRAYGYMNLLSYQETPETIMGELKIIGWQIWEQYEARIAAYSRTILDLAANDIDRPAGKVLEFGELITFCKKKDPDRFNQHYQEISQKIKAKIISGVYNVPQATVEVMRQVLDWSGITEPVMILAFAPVYYPAYHSDHLNGKEGAGSALMSIMERAASIYGLKLEKKNYFGGISDLSYCGISNPFNQERYSLNTPLWDQGYQIDMNGIEALNIPSILFGPWGKDIHQKTERVHIASVTMEIPHILWEILRWLGKV